MTVDAFLHDGVPRWEAIDFEVRCPRCGYELRLLPQARCPECGLEFDWRTVLDTSAWRSDFLFEHHWRTHPVRSWIKTTWAGLRPLRFWQYVSMHDRVQLGPLWFLLLTSVLWFAITVNLVAWLTGLALQAALRVVSPGFITPQWEWLDGMQQVMSWALFNFNNPGGDLQLLCVLHVSLLAALAVLCVLRQRVGGCRVRRVHILRVFAYASTPIYLCLGVLFVAVVGLLGLVDSRGASPVLVVSAVICGMAVMLVCPVLFLMAGFDRYMRIPRALLLAVAVVLMGVVFAATTLILIRLWASA